MEDAAGTSGTSQEKGTAESTHMPPKEIPRSARGHYKAIITRFEKYLEANKDNVNLPQTRLRLEAVKDAFKKLCDIQVQLSTPTDEDDDYIEDVENKFYAAVEEAERILSTPAPPPVTNAETQEDRVEMMASNIELRRLPPEPSLQATFSDNSSENFYSEVPRRSTRERQPELPAIHLPEFSGNIEQWFEFKDSFLAVIGNNASLDACSKMKYLKGTLKGVAAQVISKLSITADNYDRAWALLTARFENKKKIIKTYVNNFLDLPSCKRNSATSLRELTDQVMAYTQALEALGCPVNYWDELTINIVLRKLDFDTVSAWELSADYRRNSTLDQLIMFLVHRCNILEGRQQRETSNAERKNEERRFNKIKTQAFPVTEGQCQYCDQSGHPIYKCDKFKELSISMRVQHARMKKLCFNCLTSYHRSSECPSTYSCKKCQRKHHTLLHAEEQAVCALHASNTDFTMLATVAVNVKAADGEYHRCRMLLDSGAQSNFLSEKMCAKLRLPIKQTSHVISGIAGTKTSPLGTANAEIKPRKGSLQLSTSFIVLPKVAGHMPQETIDRRKFQIPPNITLADPNFNKHCRIDGILGAGIFWEILQVGKIVQDNFSLFKTAFGWIISGKITSPNTSLNAFNVELIKLSQDVQRFWIQEEIAHEVHRTKEEDLCYEHFHKTFEHQNGRFMLKLPFREGRSISEMGNTYPTAVKSLNSLENRLAKNPLLKIEYTKFINDYIKLGHMRESSPNDVDGCYLTHHAVFKNENEKQKIRVVFNASLKGPNGVSLNDTLMVGPNVQNSLFNILVRFRTNPVALVGDVEKMYRQVNLHPSDHGLLRILWREDPKKMPKSYSLVTVTQGTGPASFMATECLIVLADKAACKHPEAARAIREDFYVDDVLTGADSDRSAMSLREDIQNILCSGGFKLKKWVSNKPQILSILSTKDNQMLDLSRDQTIKTLGIHWNAAEDVFQFKSSKNEIKPNITKRSILSEIAQIYDPIGLLVPVVVVAKILLQELWTYKISWDETVPTHIHTSWNQFRKSLSDAHYIKVPRYLYCENQSVIKITLHGFSDASQKAFGACIYAVAEYNDGIKSSKLISAKSRVAPLKTVTIPRLELCAAVLLVTLMGQVRESFPHVKDEYYWTDSTIVLYWLKDTPSRWTTYVANRVAIIQRATKVPWRYIPTAQNPADLASRGLPATGLKDSVLWWNGPDWLLFDQTSWPLFPEKIDVNGNCEEKPQKLETHMCVTRDDLHLQLIKKYSKFQKLLRVTSYVYRFIKNLRLSSKERTTGMLLPKEIEEAEYKIVKAVQEGEFHEIFQLLQHGKSPKKIPLRNLNLFIDCTSQVLRVGGRLRNASISFGHKFPILLPKSHPLTSLIIRDSHENHYHAGPQLTLSVVRSRYWPLQGRRAVRSITQGCVKCFKFSPKPFSPPMGDLPANRITPCAPFQRVGIDYCGPVLVKEGSRRTQRTRKAYIAVFVCMVSKAVHLELVSDMTTDCFLAALKRFAARRGVPTEINSDNGTTFHGANNELRRIIDSEIGTTNIRNYLLSKRIKWNFIPPRAPNFGGLWEAAVKSTKTHLLRTIGETKLTFEEMCSILLQIEAVLNSRPLAEMSEDPNDLNVITPGHFLIGRALTEIPENNLVDAKLNRLQKWEHINYMKQHFWRRWKIEYLHTLQQRSNTSRQDQPAIRIGQLVIVKEETAPLHWPMARVVELFPGKDDVSRVARIKCQTGEKLRPVSKLCPLPSH